MFRILVMNGLLISLILIWTSAAKEPSTVNLIKSVANPPKGPLKFSLNEPNKEMLSRKFLCGRDYGGVCVYHKKSCPKSFPLEQPEGKPYCLKKHRCCYTDLTTAAPTTVVPTTTKTEDVSWSAAINACIRGNNFAIYEPVENIDICKEKCVEEAGVSCQSVEFSSVEQMCAISEARSDSDDYAEPCFVDGWVFAEKELNTGDECIDKSTKLDCDYWEGEGYCEDGEYIEFMAENCTKTCNKCVTGQTTVAPTTSAPANTTNNDVSCNLVWNYEEDRPLLMIRESHVIAPPIDSDINDDPNRIPEGLKLIFACPGEQNVFNHIDGIHSKLHGECVAKDQFKVCVNGYPEIMDIDTLSCSSQMQPSIIKQDNATAYKKSCEDIGGELFKMGYIYGDFREFKDLDTNICFREEDQTTLWTSTNVNRMVSSPSMVSKDPANFSSTQGIHTKTLSSQELQQETLKQVQDKEVTSNWNDKTCHNHGGYCVRGGLPCPKHLPHQTSQGEPFCNSFHRCCYSDQCEPTTCTYEGQPGKCSLDALPGTTGVGSQDCKNGCQCYIKKNKTLHQFKSLQEHRADASTPCGGGGGDECSDASDVSSCWDMQSDGRCEEVTVQAMCKMTCEVCDKVPIDVHCGIETKRIARQRIVNGRPATVDDEANGILKYSWQVGLSYHTRPEPKYFCGGSIINDKHVLTAAHCIYHFPTKENPAPCHQISLLDTDVYVGIGKSYQDDPRILYRKVIFIFDEYKDGCKGSNENDIAILRLIKPIHQIHTGIIVPICLPKDDSDNDNYYRETAIVSGWGSTEGYYPQRDPPDPGYSLGLLEAKVPIMSHTECQQMWPFTKPNILTDKMLCGSTGTGFNYGGNGFCKGDSGGPLIINRDMKHIQIGIVSESKGCAAADLPDVYTRVTKYIPWIKENAGKIYTVPE